MGKVKEMVFPEVMIHFTNKIPNDPEACFKKFADIIGTKKGDTLAGAETMQRIFSFVFIFLYYFTPHNCPDALWALSS